MEKSDNIVKMLGDRRHWFQHRRRGGVAEREKRHHADMSCWGLGRPGPGPSLDASGGWPLSPLFPKQKSETALGAARAAKFCQLHGTKASAWVLTGSVWGRVYTLDRFNLLHVKTLDPVDRPRISSP